MLKMEQISDSGEAPSSGAPLHEYELSAAEFIRGEGDYFLPRGQQILTMSGRLWR
jgi:hypothetical protein